MMQLGVNAATGLKAVGGIGTEKLPDSINGLNQMLAKGQVPQAKNSFGDLDKTAPRR